MNCFIRLILSCPDNCLVMHNGSIVPYLPGFWVYSNENSQNHLCVLNQSVHDHIDVLELEMFDLGKDKLKYLGQVFDSQHHGGYQSTCIPPGHTWCITYQHPVFPWLHETLNLGWIVKPLDPLEQSIS